MSQMFDGANTFNLNIADWNISSVTAMANMFFDASALSDSNKGLIHASFLTNPGPRLVRIRDLRTYLSPSSR